MNSLCFRPHNLIAHYSQWLAILLIATIVLCPLRCVIGQCSGQVQTQQIAAVSNSCCCSGACQRTSTNDSELSKNEHKNRQPADQCPCNNCVCKGAVATKHVDDVRLFDANCCFEKRLNWVKQWTKCSFRRNILQTFSLHALCDDSMKVRACLNSWTL